ncbi:MAG TPA: VWA domain-containing protein [Candidatus Sulfotelmatobacter sp.]|nr:VWA domain-containing protein [Candidatus Sulfotelmatobacter sp.]
MRLMTAVMATALLTLPARPQNPIQIDVNLVDVAFTARDAHGALIDSLTKEDVELFEDTVPQKIEFFAKSTDLPLTLALLMDVSGSQEHFEKEHEKDLEVFLNEVLGPKDRAFMVCFGDHLRLVSDYTNSAQQLLSGFHDFDKGKRHFSELGPTEERDGGTAFYDAIYYSVSEKLAKAQGRKAILIFSDGEDNSSAQNMMSTIEAAQTANVVVYTIRYTERNKRGELTGRNKYGISVMDRIAKETGGAHIDAEHTDPHTYFRQIAEELRTSYELAYYPTNKAHDGTFRKIGVKPKDERIQIRVKTGYFAE